MKPSQTDCATLQVSCPDSVNITALLADFFANHHLHIAKYTQYVDAGLTLVRVEWLAQQAWVDHAECEASLRHALSGINARFSVQLNRTKPTVGLFCSNQTHVVVDLLTRLGTSHYPELDFAFVVSDYESVGGVADSFGVPFYYVSATQSAGDIQRRQLEIIARYQPDYLGLARYDSLLSQGVIEQANCPILSVHNSFLPSLKSEKAYSMTHEQGLKLVGATTRLVQVDALGPVVGQDVIRLGPGLSEEEVRLLGHEVERKVFADALQKLVEHKVMVYNAKTIVFD